MPVVDTRQFSKLPKKKSRKSRLPILLVLFVIVGGAVFIYNRYIILPRSQKDDQTPIRSKAGSAQQKSKTSLPKEFTGEQFKELAQAVKYPNTQLFAELPMITGNKIADARIRKIAESRGYVLTSIPEASIEKINEPRLEGDDLLQPLAAIAWRDLKVAAKRDKILLSIISAYRSPEYQRNLFTSRLDAKGVTVSSIIEGQADSEIETVLSRAAVPGYSRHHTGYTIDLWCEDGASTFLVSSCYKWISTDNYKIAKQAGWIPSYPDNVAQQGPEPEPWEYVWVGKDLIAN